MKNSVFGHLGQEIKRALIKDERFLSGKQKRKEKRKAERKKNNS